MMIIMIGCVCLGGHLPETLPAESEFECCCDGGLSTTVVFLCGISEELGEVYFLEISQRISQSILNAFV